MKQLPEEEGEKGKGNTVNIDLVVFNSGHSRQGWKCRLCKINVHGECRNGVARCLPKSRLLRRQKSNSELEMQGMADAASTVGDDDTASNVDEIDQTYTVLKQAGELGNISGANHRRQHSSSATVRVPSSENLADAKSHELAGSTGAINRPVSYRVNNYQPRASQNSLSVGGSDHPSFQPSISGDRCSALFT